MTSALEQSAAFPAVRAKVKEMLVNNSAYRGLEPDKQRQLAHDMVKVASYIVGGDSGDNTPAAMALTDSTGRSVPAAVGLEDEPFEPGTAGARGVDNLSEAINRVDFPTFVAGLIDGVFNAIVDASIKQMEAYSELVANVAKSVDQFMKDNVSKNQARDYLAGQYPDFLEVDLGGEEPNLRPKEGYDEENLPDFFSDLGLSLPVDDFSEDAVEEQLVPAARRRIAMDRQQLLATMVLMGINRIIVTNGNLSASVLFRLNTKDLISSTRSTATEWEREVQTKSKFARWDFRTERKKRWYGYYEKGDRDITSNLNVSTSQEDESDAEAKLHTELKGNVNINFRSETFPLEQMTDILQVQEIRAKAPNFSRTSPTSTEEQAAPS